MVEAVREVDDPFLRMEREQQQGNRLSWLEIHRGVGEEEEVAAGAGVKCPLGTWVCQPEEEGAGAEERSWGVPPWKACLPEGGEVEEEGR